MATNFPTSLDSATTSSSSDYLSTGPHSTLHNNLEDRTVALETKVGADASAVTTSHDYKLSGVTGTDKAVSKTGTETLTNKTLTTPVIPSIYQDAGKTKLMTVPDTASDTLVTLAATQTLTNKTLTTPTIGDFTNALHYHTSTAGGGVLNETLSGYWYSASTTASTVVDANTIDWPTLLVPLSYPGRTGTYKGPVSQMMVGDRIKVTNDSTVKYFYVTAVNDTTQTVDLFGGSSYALTGTGTGLLSNLYVAHVPTDDFPEWMAFTPAWTGLTVGTGSEVNVGYMCMNGKTVHFRVRVKIGSSGSGFSTSMLMTLPVTAATYGGLTPIGQVTFYDVGTGYFLGLITSGGNIWVGQVGGTYNIAYDVTASIPMTWAAGDEMTISGTYQVA